MSIPSDQGTYHESLEFPAGVLFAFTQYWGVGPCEKNQGFDSPGSGGDMLPSHLMVLFLGNILRSVPSENWNDPINTLY